jgi:hypothetical protein
MTTTLYVIPCPFDFLDEEGVPAAALAFDPEHGAGARRWVGATIDVGRTRILPERGGGAGSPVAFGGRQRTGVGAAPSQRTFFSYSLEPQPVLDTAHYRGAIQRGDAVVPADEATARSCGAPWREPMDVLREHATAAVAKWRADHQGADPALDLWPANLRALLSPPPPAATPSPKEPLK